MHLNGCTQIGEEIGLVSDLRSADTRAEMASMVALLAIRKIILRMVLSRRVGLRFESCVHFHGFCIFAIKRELREATGEFRLSAKKRACFDWEPYLGTPRKEAYAGLRGLRGLPTDYPGSR